MPAYDVITPYVNDIIFNTPAIDALSSNREPDRGYSSNTDLPDLSIVGTCDILVYQNVSESHVICQIS